jgi:hypothetical protein
MMTGSPGEFEARLIPEILQRLDERTEPEIH